MYVVSIHHLISIFSSRICQRLETRVTLEQHVAEYCNQGDLQGKLKYLKNGSHCYHKYSVPWNSMQLSEMIKSWLIVRAADAQGYHHSLIINIVYLTVKEFSELKDSHFWRKGLVQWLRKIVFMVLYSYTKNVQVFTHQITPK